MCKFHLIGSLTVLAISLVLTFYLLDPFGKITPNAVLLIGQDSVLFGERFPGLPLVKNKNQELSPAVLGYHCGRDRAAQLSVLAIAMKGELAVNLGNQFSWQDIWVKNINLPALADQVYAGLSSNEKLVLKSYADGINAAYQSRDFQPSVISPDLQLKPQLWQDKTVLQSIIFWLVEMVREPKEWRKWDILPWQESLFYPRSMFESDGVIIKDNDYYFSLYAQNNYPMSYYALAYNSKMQVYLPGLPFEIAQADSYSVRYILRNRLKSPGIEFVSKDLYNLLPSRLFNVSQHDKTALEFSVRDLENGFAVCQSSAGETIPYFHFDKKQLLPCVKTLLNGGESSGNSLASFGLRRYNSKDSFLNNQQKLPLPVKSASFDLKRVFYNQNTAASILPTSAKSYNFDQSYRHMNNQTLPAITIKFSPKYPKLEFLILNGASESPTDPAYNFFYSYWIKGLFLPL